MDPRFSPNTMLQNRGFGNSQANLMQMQLQQQLQR
jgi:hypothetical protein